MGHHEIQTPYEDIFEIKTANEWLSETPDVPSQMLLGDLWQTGEIAVMFAEPGDGKSLLAVQIAESIARGVSIEPFEMSAPAQKVLYIDLEQSPGQFRRRYTADIESGAKNKPRCHQFSQNFFRVTLKDVIELNPIKLAPLIEQSGAKVVIIDNIAYLQKYSIPRETAVVMRELRRLRNRYGLSILVLTHTARTTLRRGIAAADMACSGVMTNFADNIFAIGRYTSRSSSRYIKHVKPASTALAYGAAHLPWFNIVKRNKTFLALDFAGYANEAELKAGDGHAYEWDTIREIKRRSVGGDTIRKIADDLKMAKTTVYRYLKMAPEIEETPEHTCGLAAGGTTKPVFYGPDKCIYERCADCMECRPGRNFSSVPGNIYGHGECPDDCDICGPRRYDPGDMQVDPHLKQLSDTFFKQLRDWVIADKQYPRPVYPGARRYGIEPTGWFPGSEVWDRKRLVAYGHQNPYGRSAEQPEWLPIGTRPADYDDDVDELAASFG